jgi:hypothetical protein
MEDDSRAELRVGRHTPLVLTHDCHGYVERGHGDPAWHRFHVTFAGFGFKADFFLETWLMPLIAFRDGLARLSRDLAGGAKLETLEHELKLQGHIDKLGHILWVADLFQHPSRREAHLHFELEDDQTSLPGLIAQLDAMIESARNEVALR